MVGKAKAVAGSTAGQAYLENVQKQEIEKLQEQGYELARNMLIGETPEQISDEMKAWNQDNPEVSHLKKQVFTMVMSPSIEDGTRLNDNELIQMGKEFMVKTLGVDPDSQPYRMYVEPDKEHKHVYIYTPKTDKDGKTISDSFIELREQRAADEVAASYGLTRTKAAVQEGAQDLKELLRNVATRSVSFEDYCQRAEKEGIKILPTINKQGQMQGYRVEYQGKEYKSSVIDRSLTASKLAPLFEQNLHRQKVVDNWIAGQQEQVTDHGQGYELARNMLIGETPDQVNNELKAWNQDNPEASHLKRQLFTMVMAPSIEEGKKLSDDELSKMGKELMGKTLGVDPDSQPYRMYVRTDKAHKLVYAYTPRTDKDGKTINDSFIGVRAQRAADEVAASYGLTRINTAVQEEMLDLKEILKSVATQSVSFENYCQQAEKKGAKIVPTADNKGNVQGYKIEYQGKRYKDSSIDRNLAVPRLAPLFEHNLRKQKLVESRAAGQEQQVGERGYELTRNMLIGETPKEINDELKAWNLDNPQASRLKRQVFTMVMSPSIEDGKKLSDDDLIKMGKSFMAKTLGVDPDSQPYRMYVHTDKEHKHVHIYTPRTDKDGKTISDSFIGMRAQRAADEVALEHGLIRAKTVVQERTKDLKELLRNVATRSVSFEDYCQRADKEGIKILPTINKQGQMQGYRVEYQGKDYKASAIDRKLTAPKLAPLFEQNLRKQKTIERSQGFGMGM